MKLTKRVLAVLLAAAMLAIGLPVLGASAAEDSAVLALEESTFKSRTSERMGTFVDGRLEFNKNESVKTTLNLNELLTLTPGEKVARVYLRSPQKVAGEFEFFKTTVKSGKQSNVAQGVKGSDLAAYQNKSFVSEVKFNVASGETVNITLNYNGNFSIIIDRIEVVPVGTPSAAQAIVKQGETTGSVNTYAFTADDLAQATIIDSFSIAYGNTNVMIPASYLKAWFDAGYTKATMTFNSADTARQKRLATKMNGYNARNYMVSVFDFDITLTDASGKDVALTSLPGSISVESVVPTRITSKLTDGARKLCIGYQNADGSVKDNGSFGSLAVVDSKLIATTNLTDTGTILVAVACMK